MQCTKPMWEIVRGGYTKGYACTLYDAKFGGTSDKEIESLSRSSYDDCAFKDKLRACMNPRKPPMQKINNMLKNWNQMMRYFEQDISCDM